MRVARIPHQLQGQVKKLWYSNQSSSPFISPDTFRGLADLDLDRNFNPTETALRDASIIFINSGDVEKFFSSYANRVNARVLIFGNNDVDFIDFNYVLPKSVERVLLQNSTVENPKFTTIPIGIESIKYVTNGLPNLVSGKYSQRTKLKKLLVGPFGNTHRERLALLGLQRKFACVDFVDHRLRPKKYAELSSSYAFIACPRGNGLDTHRFWETLYRGSIPVVIRSPWSKNWSDRGVPVVEIETWDCDLDQVVHDAEVFLPFDPNKLDLLWDWYWVSELRSSS